MKVLFLDNFRGFSNTYVPIEDVNFLVGENSTGKTSLLGLLKLISSPELWLQNMFNTPDVNFGHFNDIVSVSAANRSYFSIGFAETIKDKKDKMSEQIRAFLITYTERNGRPQPTFYMYSYGDKAYSIQITKQNVKYKVRQLQKYDDINKFMAEVFALWVKEHEVGTLGYTAVPKEIREALTRAPLMIMSSMLESLIDKKNRIQDSILGPGVPPSLISEMAWLAPIRSKPRRTYDEYKLDFSPDGQHTPYLIKKILEMKSEAVSFKKFLEKIGVNSGLFESIIIRKYGRGSTAPFELDVLLNEKALSISNVGYGVSQALPVIVEAFTRPKGTWLAIQQPEVHLHPKAQAVLGDVFYDLALREKKKFIIETHSDYAIDRFRLNYSRNTSNKEQPKAQILYFERTGQGNTIYQLPIGNNGELPTEQPSGYRSFFITEEIKLMEL